MTDKLLGIHHVTALASDPQQNVDFYTGMLGLRLVKKTVNFDAPDVYHLYYGDETGHPGTILTFFPFPDAARGKRGIGEVSAVAFSLPLQSLDFWIERLASRGIHFDGPQHRLDEEFLAFQDPDGMSIEFVFSENTGSREPWSSGPIPGQFAIRGFSGVTLSLGNYEGTASVLTSTLGFRLSAEKENRFRFAVGSEHDEAHVDIVVQPNMPWARTSAGSVHHIAWRVRNDVSQQQWRETIVKSGIQATEIIDRQYFHSVYFREPGGVLFEIATDNPGFTVDESREKLGSDLKLPPSLESQRSRIERILIPIAVPRTAELRIDSQAGGTS